MKKYENINKINENENETKSSTKYNYKNEIACTESVINLKNHLNCYKTQQRVIKCMLQHTYTHTQTCRSN